MKWKISTHVILRRREGFYEQELLYFVVFFESADQLTGRAKHLGRLQSLKLVVMDATLGTGIFKPEKNLEFFRLKNPGTQRWLSW